MRQVYIIKDRQKGSTADIVADDLFLLVDERDTGGDGGSQNMDQTVELGGDVYDKAVTFHHTPEDEEDIGKTTVISPQGFQHYLLEQNEDDVAPSIVINTTSGIRVSDSGLSRAVGLLKRFLRFSRHDSGVSSGILNVGFEEPANTGETKTMLFRHENGWVASEALVEEVRLALLDGVTGAGNTLQKLYNLILANMAQDQVSNIAARNAYNIPFVGFQLFVLNDGDGNWAMYRATTTGIGATFVKLSDPDLLNAQMSNAAIKAAYESNSDTNAFTNALLSKLNAIASGATANSSDAYLLSRTNHSGTQPTSTISGLLDFVLREIYDNGLQSPRRTFSMSPLYATGTFTYDGSMTTYVAIGTASAIANEYGARSVSAASAGSSAGFASPNYPIVGPVGVQRWGLTFKISDTSYVSAARLAVGYLPSVSSILNSVNPSTFVGSFFVGADDTDTNLQVMHNDQSGTCTKVNTGWPLSGLHNVGVHAVFEATPTGTVTGNYMACTGKVTLTRLDTNTTISFNITTDFEMAWIHTSAARYIHLARATSANTTAVAISLVKLFADLNYR